MVDVINYARARGRVLSSECSERRLGARAAVAPSPASGAQIAWFCSVPAGPGRGRSGRDGLGWRPV